MMFPGRGDMHGVRLARAICRTCPVKKACAEYGVEHIREVGIYGGLSERERRRERRRRRAAA